LAQRDLGIRTVYFGHVMMTNVMLPLMAQQGYARIILKIAADEQPTEREKRQVHEYVRRRAKPRFYADENFPTIAIKILRRLGADVLTVRDLRRHGHPDENHTAEALRLGRILITCDRDYLDDRRFPLIHCPALIVCDFGSGTADDISRTKYSRSEGGFQKGDLKSP
jgi:predicted nuclease of predicted toxin-antitoxin system